MVAFIRVTHSRIKRYLSLDEHTPATLITGTIADSCTRSALRKPNWRTPLPQTACTFTLKCVSHACAVLKRPHRPAREAKSIPYLWRSFRPTSGSTISILSFYDKTQNAPTSVLSPKTKTSCTTLKFATPISEKPNARRLCYNQAQS